MYDVIMTPFWIRYRKLKHISIVVCFVGHKTNLMFLRLLRAEKSRFKISKNPHRNNMGTKFRISNSHSAAILNPIFKNKTYLESASHVDYFSILNFSNRMKMKKIVFWRHFASSLAAAILKICIDEKKISYVHRTRNPYAEFQKKI